MADEPPRFSKDSLPGSPTTWPEYRKTKTTRAVRISGPFEVVTVHDETPVRCEDGWLALDQHGHPYPIGDAEFRRTYTPADW
jgi:hypothetical protein